MTDDKASSFLRASNVVEWKNGYPQILSVCMHLIGKEEYALADILYSENKVEIKGERFSYSGEKTGGEYFRELSRIE